MPTAALVTAICTGLVSVLGAIAAIMKASKANTISQSANDKVNNHILTPHAPVMPPQSPSEVA